MEMLTPRQHEILDLIVRLYASLESPVGSKTLLKKSLLEVSPATIRNEMVVLEKNGYIVKAHTSSGRIPSYEGYRYYVDRLIHHENRSLADQYQSDRQAVKEIFDNRSQDSFKMAKMVADLLVSLTNYPTLIFEQSNEEHLIDNFKLVHLSDHQVMLVLLTNLGYVESRIYTMQFDLNPQVMNELIQLLNDELIGVSLEDAYQRLKLTIPMLMQRRFGIAYDFSDLVERAIHQVKGQRYQVLAKNNLFDLIGAQEDVSHFKDLFNLIDGSKEIFELLEQRDLGIDVLFGQDFLPVGNEHLALVTGTLRQDNQKMTIGILGPSTMRFTRIIALMEQVLIEFNH